MSDPTGSGQTPRVPRVTVVTRADCHLCQDAEAAVGRLDAELGFGWRSVDVDGSPQLQAEYGERVPVILVDGVEHGYWRVEEARLRRALAAAPASGRRRSLDL